MKELSPQVPLADEVVTSSVVSPVYTCKLAQYGFSMGLVSPIEVVRSKLARPTFVAVYTASCNRTGPT